MKLRPSSGQVFAETIVERARVSMCGHCTQGGAAGAGDQIQSVGRCEAEPCLRMIKVMLVMG